METVKKIFSWLGNLPFWLRLSVVFLVAVLVFVLSLTSCGTTRAVAKTSQQGVTTISITTNNPITSDVSPDVHLKKP